MRANSISRYQFSNRQQDEQGRLFLDDRKPYRYEAIADNRTHVVREGETLWTIASMHYRSLDRPAGLWWVIADFQPNPIHDPTIQLAPASVLVLPSLRTVVTRILSTSRYRESHL